jgi:hypothetical protein
VNARDDCHAGTNAAVVHRHVPRVRGRADPEELASECERREAEPECAVDAVAARREGFAPHGRQVIREDRRIASRSQDATLIITFATIRPAAVAVSRVSTTLTRPKPRFLASSRSRAKSPTLLVSRSSSR